MHRQMWTEYRATWEAFSRKLHELQESEQGPAGAWRRRVLLVEVEDARERHAVARDHLAARLSQDLSLAPAPAKKRSEEAALCASA